MQDKIIRCQYLVILMLLCLNVGKVVACDPDSPNVKAKISAKINKMQSNAFCLGAGTPIAARERCTPQPSPTALAEFDTLLDQLGTVIDACDTPAWRKEHADLLVVRRKYCEAWAEFQQIPNPALMGDKFRGQAADAGLACMRYGKPDSAEDLQSNLVGFIRDGLEPDADTAITDHRLRRDLIGKWVDSYGALTGKVHPSAAEVVSVVSASRALWDELVKLIMIVRTETGKFNCCRIAHEDANVTAKTMEDLLNHRL